MREPPNNGFRLGVASLSPISPEGSGPGLGRWLCSITSPGSQAASSFPFNYPSYVARGGTQGGGHRGPAGRKHRRRPRQARQPQFTDTSALGSGGSISLVRTWPQGSTRRNTEIQSSFGAPRAQLKIRGPICVSAPTMQGNWTRVDFFLSKCRSGLFKNTNLERVPLSDI